MIKKCFLLGLTTIPFSGVIGLGFLGELQHELSTYFFMAAIMGSTLSFATSSGVIRLRQGEAIPSPRLLTAIMTFVVLVIAVSFFVNVISILTNVSHGRYAIEKFISSFVLILYGFMLAYLTFFLAGRSWEQRIYRPIAISAALCAGFSAFEILARHFGVATGIYASLDNFVHGGLNPVAYAKGWDLRIRSLSFEPPAFGNYAGFAWPWLIAGWLSGHGRGKLGYAAVCLLLTALVLFSGCRTGIILITSSAFVLAVLRYGYLPPKLDKRREVTSIALTTLLVYLVLVVVLFCFANFEQYQTEVIARSSVSDLSRLASIEAALNMFLDNPIVGLGLGQFGFYIFQNLPPWGHLSYEIVHWLNYPDLWPASYSVYARLGAELGLSGLLMWIGLWVLLARQVLIASLNYQRASERIPFVAYPLIASCYCVLFSGFTTDTFRTPMIWVALGLCCRYVFEVQTRGNAERQRRCSNLRLVRSL
jgi:hypothetical protein